MRKLLLAILFVPAFAYSQSFQLQYRGGQIDTAVSTALRLQWVEVVYDSTILTTSRKYSYFQTMEDTVVIDTVLAWGSGTVNLTIQVSFDDTVNSASATDVFGSAQTVNSSTVGNRFSSFSNATIPSNSFVWITTPGLTTVPRELAVLMRYHYKNLR